MATSLPSFLHVWSFNKKSLDTYCFADQRETDKGWSQNRSDISASSVMSLVAGYGFATFGDRKGIDRSWLMTVAVVIHSCGSSTNKSKA
ncbi:hypothetical protein HanXRQr2_Chr00c006g0832621 [Helianthus annuus]|uniref:Uncharacterized protein n=1 Tax=Helianthus annuus TaxID=4232 RepID=A0A9K3K063_HELAN|nr:hypothetical protein HanXRQr2_Chr00c006g0832621 [Helianthus annuus]